MKRFLQHRRHDARFFRAAAMILTSLASLSCALADPLRAVTEEGHYAYHDASGKVAGPASDVVEAVFREAAIEDYKLSIYPWARSYSMALSEPNILIYLISRTPEREPLFQWIGEVMRDHYYFYRLRSRPEVQASDLKEASRLVVGVVRDDVRHQFLKQKGFPRLVLSAQAEEAFAKLLNRQVDLVVLSAGGAFASCKEAGIDCHQIERLFTVHDMDTSDYMALSLGTPVATVQRLRTAFDKLKSDGRVDRLMSTAHHTATPQASPGSASKSAIK